MVRPGCWRLAVATLLAAAAPLSWGLPAPAAAQTRPQAAPECGAHLGEPFRERWLALGGAKGRLGCPTAPPEGAAPSPQGVTGRQALFTDGAILLHGSGPRAGQAFAVDGCMFRLYFQYGGSGGRLGFPIDEAVNTPDGKRQSFEGGRILWQRASDSCSTESLPAEAAAPEAGLTRLDLFIAPGGRAFALASQTSAARASQEGFKPVATLGYVFSEPAPGRIALKSYVDPASGDHDTVATRESESADLAAGYEFAGLQGFVWRDPHPGSAALEHFWNPGTKSSLLASSPAAEAEATAKGYVFVRIEGYVSRKP